jgi:PilZ domain-containing protein
MDRAVEETTFSFSQQAPEKSDRRKQSRQISILRVGTLIVDGRRELCLVRNISAGGLMAHAYSTLQLGQRVEAELKSGQSIPGKVAWIEKATVGIAFDQPIDLEDMLTNQTGPNGEKPRLPRVEVDSLATLRVGARIYGANTRDISQGGVKLEMDEAVPVGTEVVLTLDQFRPVKGTVRWCQEGLCGVEFHSTIPFQELMTWLRQHGGKANGSAQNGYSG